MAQRLEDRLPRPARVRVDGKLDLQLDGINLLRDADRIDSELTR